MCPTLTTSWRRTYTCTASLKVCDSDQSPACGVLFLHGDSRNNICTLVSCCAWSTFWFLAITGYCIPVVHTLCLHTESVKDRHTSKLPKPFTNKLLCCFRQQHVWRGHLQDHGHRHLQGASPPMLLVMSSYLAYVCLHCARMRRCQYSMLIGHGPLHTHSHYSKHLPEGSANMSPAHHSEQVMHALAGV